MGITSTFWGSKCLLLKETNTPTRPRIEPGSPDPESDALTIRPVRPPHCLLYRFHIVYCIGLYLYARGHIDSTPDSRLQISFEPDYISSCIQTTYSNQFITGKHR